MVDNSGEGPRRPLLGRGELLKTAATRSRGPGEKFHPVSLEDAWKELAPQAKAMASGIAGLPGGAVGHHLVFECTLRPNYLAPTYHPGEMLKGGMYVVGTRRVRATKVTQKKEVEDQATKRLIIAGSPAAVKQFAARLESAPTAATEKQWETFRRLTDVSLPRKESVILSRPESPQAEGLTFEAVLTHVGDGPQCQRWANDHFDRFVEWVHTCGGMVDRDYRRDLGRLTFVPVFAPPEALDHIARFNLLRAIRPMPEIAPFPDHPLRAASKMPRRSKMALAGDRPVGTVAIFDGGVHAGLPVFAPFVTCFDLTTEPPDAFAMRHGSMVTSAVLYGSVDPGGQLPDPTVAVDHWRVLPLPPLLPGMPDRRLYQMLDNIVDCLRSHSYPLVGLAIGPDQSVDDTGEPDRFTAELDVLMKDLDITIVSAVGNNGELDQALGFDRVQPPGDCVNGLGVGATTRKLRNRGVKLERAPYSARGPGREGQRVQPAVVEFGGSTDEPFLGFDERGQLMAWAGTSFAAPTVVRTLGGLQAAVVPERHTPDIFRVFAVHTAERRRGHKHCDLGFGRILESFDAVFECAPHEVTVLYEDMLPRDQVVAMHLPFPAGLPPATTLELAWTIAFLSDVDPRDASDYTLSGIDVVFRPDDRVRTLTNPKTREAKKVRKDVDLNEITAGLREGFTLSEPAAHSGWRRTKSEQQLRCDGKWETIIPGRALLTAEELCLPRLDLQHLRRQNGQLDRGPGVLPLRFSMLVTIRAQNHVHVYDLVASQYRVLAPITRIPIRLSA